MSMARIAERYKSQFWYLLYSGNEPTKDEFGNETGEGKPTYKEAVSMRANISAAAGAAQIEQFGNLQSYDKVILTDETDCPIEETTVLFIDKEPEYAEDGTPLYDYIVKRVAKSKNIISIAVSKVSVS